MLSHKSDDMHFMFQNLDNGLYSGRIHINVPIKRIWEN